MTGFRQAKFRQAMWAMAVLLPAAVCAQQRTGIVGSLTSSASVVIDDVAMQTTAAAAWPVVEGDEIGATSAPALLTTTDGNLITFERDSKAKVKTIENGQPYLYVRQGGVLFETKTPRLNICIGNRLFVPAAGAKGILRWEKSGAVTRMMTAGQILEQGNRACDDQEPGAVVTETSPNQISSANQGGAAGGTASGGGAPPAGGTATAPIAAPGGRSLSVGAIGAASAAAAGAVGAFFSSCTASGGCNHVPLAISSSTP
jgi:hypothetical protein